jgi:TolB protein
VRLLGLSARALLLCVGAALVGACGGDAATQPSTGGFAPETAITFAYTTDQFGFPDSWDLFQIGADGQGVRAFVAQGKGDHDPEWSPFGGRLVYTRYDEKTAESSVWIIEADGTGNRQLPIPGRAFGARWSPDGTSLVFFLMNGAGSGIAVIRADGTGLRALGPAGMSVFGDPAWSRDNRIAFVAAGVDVFGYPAPGGIWTMKTDGSAITRLILSGSEPVWSRDGSRLAFVRYSTAPGRQGRSVFVVNADGSGEREVTTEGDNVRPAWSPDGRWLLMDRYDRSARDGFRCALYKVPAAGGTAVNLTPNRGIGMCGGSSWR